MGLSLALALYAAGQARSAPPQAAAGRSVAMVADEPVQIGAPYSIGGKIYTPEDPPGYDELGYARVYGVDGVEGTTANGEPFIAGGISAAHRTLPLPSYVEVTSLETGRTILVRVNDRGPMTGDGIIALSPGAAAQLGMAGGGSAPVRIRRVNPPEQERAILRAHGRAAERLDTPASLLVVLRQRLGAPTSPTDKAVVPDRKAVVPPGKAQAGATFTPPPAQPAPTVAPLGQAKRKPPEHMPRPEQASGDAFVVEGEGASPSPNPQRMSPAPASLPAHVSADMKSGGYVVQVAAFSSQARAQALASKIGGGVVQAGRIWRVRLGPFATQEAARQSVRAVAAKGLENARIMANDAP